MKRYWLIYDGTGSVEGGSGWCLVVLVSRRRYWLVLGGTGSVGGGTGWYLVVLGQ